MNKQDTLMIPKGELNVPGDYRTRRTAPRHTITNYGFNNPRIVKRKLNR